MSTTAKQVMAPTTAAKPVIVAEVPKLKTKTQQQQQQQIKYPFWFGGSASCFAACVTHPLDLVKVRLQTQSNGLPRKNMVQMFVHVVRTDGIRGLYRGLSASLLRQLTYSTTRFGVYEELKSRAVPSASSSDKKNAQPPFAALVAMACVSGFAGGVAGNPGDLVNVRMQNDSALPPRSRRNYKHAIDGIIRMSREEGVRSLWRGVCPNSMRAVLMTASQLASYDIFKQALMNHLHMEDNMQTHFAASLSAGFVATTVCSPFDVLKTRIMSMSGKQSLVEMISDTFRTEGWTWMFRGWVPSFIRLGPHTIATFLFLEQHKKIYRQLFGKPEVM